MILAQQLHDLQDVDIQIEEIAQSIQQMEAELGETQALLDAREISASAEERVVAVRSTLRDAELELGQIEAKIKEHSQKLYSGSVKNPKELASLEKDVELLQKHRGELDEKILGLMSEFDEVQSAASRALDELNAIVSAWESEQASLRQRLESASQKQVAMQEVREKKAAAVPAGIMDTYENLRRARRGRAVAKVEQSICQGCRVALPAREVQAARLNPNLSFCSNCGRVLLVGR